MLTFLSITVSALLSGLLATGIMIQYQRRMEARNAKIRLFQQLLGNRHVLLPGPHDVPSGLAFSAALNQIFLLFNDAPAVLAALKALQEILPQQTITAELRTQRLLELFKSIAQHLKLNTEPLGEGYFMKAIGINSVFGLQLLNPEFIGVQMNAGQPAVVGFLSFSETQKIAFFAPLETARLIGCTLIELAAVGREREVEIRNTAGIEVVKMGPELLQRIDRRRALNA